MCEEQGRRICLCVSGRDGGGLERDDVLVSRVGKVEIPPNTEKPRRSDVIMFFTVELTGQIPKESQELELVLGKQVRGSFPDNPTELRPTCMSNF